MTKDMPSKIVREFLLNVIQRIILDNGGGIKMKDLICQITSIIYDRGYDVPEHLVTMISTSITNHKDLKILNYSTNISDKTMQGQFVYLNINS